MGTALPDDILLLLFDLVSHPTSLSWPDVVYDDERAKAPFALASVCQRWRALAVSVASLWTYFGFPAKWHENEAHAPRLRILLARARDAEVDVVGLWPNSKAPNAISSASEEIIGAISNIALRWRYVNLNVPVSYAPFFSGAFKQQWSCLRSLSLEHRADIPELPPACHLTELYCNFIRFKYSDALPNFMPNLTKLSINGDGSGGTNKMLEAIAQQLIDLCILEDVSDPPKQPVLFPQLRSLTLDDASYLNHIRAPTLQTLTLNTAHYYNISCLEPFESVLHLCLYGRVWGELAYLLQQLPNIVHLTFEVIAHSKRTWPGADKYIIERGFFEALRLSSSDSLPAWRRLEYIRFGHSGCIGAGAILEPQELIDFVVHRNVVHEHFEDTGETVKLRPARIHTVTVDFEGASELLISELNMKLSTT